MRALEMRENSIEPAAILECLYPVPCTLTEQLHKLWEAQATCSLLWMTKACQRV